MSEIAAQPRMLAHNFHHENTYAKRCLGGLTIYPTTRSDNSP